MRSEWCNSLRSLHLTNLFSEAYGLGFIQERKFMLEVYSIDGITPVVHPSAYVHPSAVLIGDVFVGPRCYVGPNAVMRGDFGRLVMEEVANLQDTCVMHGFPGKDTLVEADGPI